MKKTIITCDFCGNSADYELVLPVMMPRELVCEAPNCAEFKRKIKIKTIDCCEECAKKIFKSFDNEVKDILRK